MSEKLNAVVGQSGGPTAAINATLAGVIMQAARQTEIKNLLGAKNGIKGVLKGDFINLTKEFSDSDRINLLRQTPSAFLGSCRYKIRTDDDVKSIIDVLLKNDVGYFFYIGGNDSMDTVFQLRDASAAAGIRVIGIPKTIDNDLAVTDHCPGFGSSAKYIAAVISEIAMDSACYDVESVTIVEIMGRNAGWLTASSALARLNGKKEPHLIYLPEVPFDIERFVDDVREKIKEYKNVVVAVSEGIRDAQGNYVQASGAEHKEDLFGHVQLGGAGKALESIVKNRLGIKVRSIELNTPQRCASHIASKTDIDESVRIGMAGVSAAISGKNGRMMVYRRTSGSPYKIEIDDTDIAMSANAEKKIPADFIADNGHDVTDGFIEYAMPLIQGEINTLYKNGIPVHIRIE